MVIYSKDKNNTENRINLTTKTKSDIGFIFT